MDPSPFLAAGSALAGIGIGAFATSKREQTSWLRERRFETVRGVIDAARVVLWRGDEINPANAELSMPEQKERVRQAILKLRESLYLVDLLYKGEVAAAAEDLEGHFGNVLYVYFNDLTEQADSHHVHVNEARACLIRFQHAVRDTY